MRIVRIAVIVVCALVAGWAVERYMGVRFASTSAKVVHDAVWYLCGYLVCFSGKRA